MKLSYSMALFLPPLLSNLETNKSKTTGDTANPKLYKASFSSLESILPLLSLSNLSKMDCKKHRCHRIRFIYKNKVYSNRKSKFPQKKKNYPPALKTVEYWGEFLWPCIKNSKKLKLFKRYLLFFSFSHAR